MLEGEQSESSKGKNWDEAFHLYANAVSSENDEIKVQATIKLAKMSKYAPENVLELTVPVLLELLQSPPSRLSPLVQEASAYCLKCIASQGEGRLAELIGQLGVIPILLRQLSSSEQASQIMLLKCLRNVITFWVPNRMILACNGGLEIVLAMLSSCLDNLKKLILLEILSALALIREVRKSLWNLRRVHHLVEAASCGSSVSRARAAQAIGLLGLIKRARRTLVNAGAVPVLIELLKVGDSDMKLVAGNALGVLSSHVDHIRPIAQAGAIPLYAELLKASPTGKCIAEDVFCILAVFEENASTIVELLVRILRGDDAGAKAAAADVIWDLSSYKSALSALQNSGAIPILLELLKDDDISVKEKVAAAVAQLTNSDGGRAILANSGAIPLLIDMLDDESDELRDNVAEALVNFSLDPLLADHTSCLSGNPLFQNMRNRVMQMQVSEEHLDASLSQMGKNVHGLGVKLGHAFTG